MDNTKLEKAQSLSDNIDNAEKRLSRVKKALNTHIEGFDFTISHYDKKHNYMGNLSVNEMAYKIALILTKEEIENRLADLKKEFEAL